MKKQDDNNIKTIYLKPLIFRIIITCIIIEIVLFFLDSIFFFITSPDEKRTISIIFDMSIEEGLAGWLSSIEILFVGITIWLIFLWVRKNSNSFDKTGWFIFAVFFTYMGIDDGTEIHEQAGTWLTHLSFKPGTFLFMCYEKLKTYPSYAWQVIFVPIFSVLTLFMIYFLWKKLKDFKMRKYLILAGVCYGIAAGLDFFDGLYNSAYILKALLPFKIDRTAVTHFLRIIEEMLEMFGTTVFWLIFLNYLSDLIKNSRVLFKEDK